MRFLVCTFPVFLFAPLSQGMGQRLEPTAVMHVMRPTPLHLQPVRAGDGTLTASLDQVLAASVSSALVGYGLFLALDNASGQDRRVKGDEGYTPNANSGYVVGSFVAATATVMWSGRSHGQSGTWIGSSVGGAIVAVPLLFLSRDEPLFLPMTLVVLAPLQALSSTIGYLLARTGN